jgi:hypothetical protein
MSRLFYPLAAAGAFGLFVFSCGSGKAPGGDGGDDGATEAGVIFTYAPTGCKYTVTPASFGGSPPSSGNFQDQDGNDTLALDDQAAPTGDITPSLVRVGIGGATDSSAAGYADPRTTAAFMWETPTPTHAAKVKIGTSATAITDVHTGYSWITPKGLGSSTTNAHAVHVCGLTAGTTYYYQVGGGPAGQETWSAVQSFTTVPDTGSVTVGVFGDARDTISTWQLVHERMLQAGVAIQLIPGDIVDIGSQSDLWRQWLTSIWQDSSNAGKFITLGQQLMVPIAGNHEAEASQFYGNWVIPGDGNYAGTYSSFDVGNTHFVMIDDQFANNTDLTQEPAKTQLAWLDADLARANANRTKVPFIVALNHRGLYSTSNHSTDGDVLRARGALAPIFDKYAVDAVFNGHDHEYERSNPIKAGSPPTGDPVVGSGTTYIICAGAGADPYLIGKISKPYSAKQVAFGTSTPYIGTYALLTLNANTLKIDAYGLKASGTDDVIDTLTLTH